MTPEQKAAITACIEAFNIPRDRRDFRLVVSSTDDGIGYGENKRIAVALEVEHQPISVCDV
jgi:hypothetical protein